MILNRQLPPDEFLALVTRLAKERMGKKDDD